MFMFSIIILLQGLGCRICKAFTNIISDIIFENEQIKVHMYNYVHTLVTLP